MRRRRRCWGHLPRRPRRTPCSSRRRSAPCRRSFAAYRPLSSRRAWSTAGSRFCWPPSHGSRRSSPCYCSSGRFSSRRYSRSRSSACWRLQTLSARYASRNTRRIHLGSGQVAAAITSTIAACSSALIRRGTAQFAQRLRARVRLCSSGRGRAVRRRQGRQRPHGPLLNHLRSWLLADRLHSFTGCGAPAHAYEQDLITVLVTVPWG
mmetsp:Transcript_7788/g.15884  ORF Transcript_7788/g.15884 Transcript_7788/m.15884 type:complete len:207 (+) Transcript_7788:726-1346(+)